MPAFRILAALAIVLARPVSVRAQDSTFAVEGTVLDSTSHRPVAGVSVSSVGSGRPVFTDPEGRFSLEVPAGSDHLTFRRIGYAPREVPLNQGTGDRRVLAGTILLRAVALPLDSINVLVDLDRENPALSEFFRRMRTGAGRYLTRADILKLHPAKVSDVLRTVPGVEVRCPAWRGCQIFTRAGGRVCLNGMLINPPGPAGADVDPDAIPVDQIVAVEVYNSRWWAPPGYSGCAILLWSEPPG